MTTPYASEAYLHQLLGKALAAQASDVHLKAGQPPGARVRGDMVYFRVDRIRPEDTDAVARVILGTKDRLDGLLDRVVIYEAGAVGRFRVTLYRQRGSLALVMRHLPAKVPSLEELGMPPAVASMVDQNKGLIVVAGAAGQGKSTTIAAMIGHLNAGSPRHVITIEDPIEILHEDNRSSISQREIGPDAPNFTAAIRAAHRQDPDVVVVSAIDGPATLDAALSLVEAGKLVITALSVVDAPRAVSGLFAIARAEGAAEDARPVKIERIIDGLAGIIAQRLVPKRDGKGVIAAVDILVATPAVRDALQEPGSLDALKEMLEKHPGPESSRIKSP